MTSHEFKARFVASNSDVLCIFVPYPLNQIASLSISPEDKAILAEVGMPSDCAPFLSFGNPRFQQLQRLTDINPRLPSNFASFRAFGGNGSGDILCIHEGNGRVVYHNHDLGMKEVFINSSVSLFAESLCLFSEWLWNRAEVDFFHELKMIDPPAIDSESMWPEDYAMMEDE